MKDKIVYTAPLVTSVCPSNGLQFHIDHLQKQVSSSEMLDAFNCNAATYIEYLNLYFST